MKSFVVSEDKEQPQIKAALIAWLVQATVFQPPIGGMQADSDMTTPLHHGALAGPSWGNKPREVSCPSSVTGGLGEPLLGIALRVSGRSCCDS